MRPLFAIAPLALLLAAFGPRQQASVAEPLAPPTSAVSRATPAERSPSAATVSVIQAQAPGPGTGLSQR